MATINHLTSHSNWLVVPSASAHTGIVFVHKRAFTIFGNGIKTVDLFTPLGDPSQLAFEIHRIAENHGLIAVTAEMTDCPILAEAVEEFMIFEEAQE